MNQYLFRSQDPFRHRRQCSLSSSSSNTSAPNRLPVQAIRRPNPPASGPGTPSSSSLSEASASASASSSSSSSSSSDPASGWPSASACSSLSSSSSSCPPSSSRPCAIQMPEPSPGPLAAPWCLAMVWGSVPGGQNAQRVRPSASARRTVDQCLGAIFGGGAPRKPGANLPGGAWARSG